MRQDDALALLSEHGPMSSGRMVELHYGIGPGDHRYRSLRTKTNTALRKLAEWQLAEVVGTVDDGPGHTSYIWRRIP